MVLFSCGFFPTSESDWEVQLSKLEDGRCWFEPMSLIFILIVQCFPRFSSNQCKHCIKKSGFSVFFFEHLLRKPCIYIYVCDCVCQLALRFQPLCGPQQKERGVWKMERGAFGFHRSYFRILHNPTKVLNMKSTVRPQKRVPNLEKSNLDWLDLNG